MNDLTTSIVNGVTRVTILLLSALFLGWAMYPEYRPEISGLILGMVGGLFNVRFLSIKVRQLADLAVSRERRRFSFGFVTRLCIAFLIVMIAARLEPVSLAATIVGLFIPQLLTIPVSIIVSLRTKN
ncbi:ATP synthase subunit I [Paenibacillus sp. FSL W7-1279]|uniref:ATP synthase subunit I n=1 Tax=Paenibacillus TaxID=44249 RepID=UPI001C7D049C|nr:ATP synthase subunit I [Paenibacillus lautus]MBX4152198.1 ATP synthase subunit I [Paenibacillus lautus]